ncbi:BON domain-containing protein [Candidatus Nitrospira salsa]
MKSRLLAMSSLALAGLFVGCAATPYQESTGEYIDDSVISAKVKTDLLRCPMVSGLDIHVQTFKKRVQLSGFVNNARQAEHAATLAKEIGGVGAIENHISIK